MSIKSKLGLYSSGPPPSSNSPDSPEGPSGNAARESTTEPEETLRFGETELKREADGFYVRRLILENPVFGTRELNQFLPLTLTGIMELALSGRNDVIHPGEVLFLDTETTGLSRGAATFPFLTGLGYFNDNRLYLEQLYLDDLGGEPAYLDYLDALIASYPFMVTYNGKSFDMPLIRNRLIMNRRRGSRPMLHFDLLHILRRLFPKGTLPGNKQKDLETALLGMERVDDVPGSEIPQLYFDYKKYAVDGGMDRVFHHNLLDIQGMAFMFLEAVRVYREKDLSSPAVRSGLARILARNERVREAIEILAPMLADESPPVESSEDDRDIDEDKALRRRHLDLLFLAGLYRARLEWDEAIRLHTSAVDDFACPVSRLQLAKILEHRVKDFSAALGHTDALIEQLHGENKETVKAPGRDFAADQLEKRRNRILKKAGGKLA